MPPTVLLIGTLDTKGHEYAFVRDRIASRGHRVLVMDLGVLGEPAFIPDIGAAEVARAGGGDLVALRARGDRGAAVEVMQNGATMLVPSSSRRAGSMACSGLAAVAARR